MTDPYRPFPAATAPTTAQFDRTRLERAGVPAERVDELEAAFPDLSAEQRAEFAQFVTSNSDAAIAERFSDGGGLPAPTTEAPTEESLMNETVDELEDRIRTWNAEHEDNPEAHLLLSGRKVDLVSRLLDAYGSEQQTGDAPAATAPATADATGTVAAQTVPTAPVATTPEGAPTGTQTPDAAGAGTTTTTGGTP